MQQAGLYAWLWRVQAPVKKEPRETLHLVPAYQRAQ
jgi:hypothetical protein